MLNTYRQVYRRPANTAICQIHSIRRSLPKTSIAVASPCTLQLGLLQLSSCANFLKASRRLYPVVNATATSCDLGEELHTSSLLREDSGEDSSPTLHTELPVCVQRHAILPDLQLAADMDGRRRLH